MSLSLWETITVNPRNAGLSILPPPLFYICNQAVLQRVFKTQDGGEKKNDL